MIKYNNSNNAVTNLTAGISASATTIIVDNGTILPQAPFLLTLEHFDNGVVVVREIVKVVDNTSNVLTVVRGAGTCIQNDGADEKVQANTPHSFNSGDFASVYWTSEQVKDIQDEIEKKLDITDFQAGTYTYGATSTGTDNYSITIPGTITSYAVGQVFRFMADVDNEGNAYLNVNNLGSKEILKNHDKHLESGDIEAGQIVSVAYDGTSFQMDSQIATVVDITYSGNTQYKSGVAGEDLDIGDVCCLVDFENDYFEMKLFGTTVSSVEYEVIGNGESSSTIELWLGRRGNTSGADLVVELLDGETVVGSITVARAGLTEDTTTKQTLSWGEDITTVNGKSYTLRLRTYDNSVDADKGFYYNNNNQSICDWFSSSGRYGAVRDLVEGNNSYCGEVYLYCKYNAGNANLNGGKATLIGENNTVEYSWAGRNVGTRSVTRSINGGDSESVGQANNRILIENIPDDTYTEITFERNNSYGGDAQLSRSATTPNNTTTLNMKANNFNLELLFKGSGHSLFVNTTTISKGETAIGECGGISNIFVGQNYTYKYTSDKALGYFENKKLKYKTKYYQPLPTQNTDFYLPKDAVMVCSFSSGSNTLKQGGAEYRKWIRGAAGSSSYNNSLAEIVEWHLEGGHTYQIDFAPSAIKEFYLVD